jgi:putative two-component system response regulator
VFDALTSVRPYKKAWPAEQAFEYLAAQRHKHFDARLVDSFLGNKDQITAIQHEWRDSATSVGKL